MMIVLYSAILRFLEQTRNIPSMLYDKVDCEHQVRHFFRLEFSLASPNDKHFFFFLGGGGGGID